MKNTIITTSAMFLTSLALIFGFSDDASSKQPEVFQDNGMLVNAESKSFDLNISSKKHVSYKASGSSETGNIDCAAYDPNHHLMGTDAAKANSCSIEFETSEQGKYTFVIRNNSDDVQRYVLSVVY